jgi:hypothetical protein
LAAFLEDDVTAFLIAFLTAFLLTACLTAFVTALLTTAATFLLAFSEALALVFFLANLPILRVTGSTALGILHVSLEATHAWCNVHTIPQAPVTLSSAYELHFTGNCSLRIEPLSLF